jgi:hypothetical protein
MNRRELLKLFGFGVAAAVEVKPTYAMTMSAWEASEAEARWQEYGRIMQRVWGWNPAITWSVPPGWFESGRK